MSKLQLKRGLEANRTNITPAIGEPIYTTDTKQLYIGDGVTPGGSPVSASFTKESIGLGNVDNTSDINKPVSTALTEALVQKLPITDAMINFQTTNNLKLGYKEVICGKNSIGVIPLKLNQGNYFTYVTAELAPYGNFIPILNELENEENVVFSFIIEIVFIGNTSIPTVSFWSDLKFDGMSSTPIPQEVGDGNTVKQYTFGVYTYKTGGARYWRGFRLS